MNLKEALEIAIKTLRENNQEKAANEIDEYLQGRGRHNFNKGDKVLYLCENEAGNVKLYPVKIEAHIGYMLTPFYQINIIDAGLKSFATEDKLYTPNVKTE